MPVTPNPPHYVWTNWIMDFARANVVGLLVGAGIVAGLWYIFPSQRGTVYVQPPQTYQPPPTYYPQAQPQPIPQVRTSPANLSCSNEGFPIEVPEGSGAWQCFVSKPPGTPITPERNDLLLKLLRERGDIR